jgi:osmotically-inducible protein OsmY
MEPATAADARLAAVVASALARRRGIPAGQVTAVVCHGWVTLAGEVEWLYQRAEAYDAVHALPGVVGCTNRISVSPRTCAR